LIPNSIDSLIKPFPVAEQPKKPGSFVYFFEGTNG